MQEIIVPASKPSEGANEPTNTKINRMNERGLLLMRAQGEDFLVALGRSQFQQVLSWQSDT